MRNDMTKVFHEPGRNGGGRSTRRGKRVQRDIADGITFEPIRRDRDRERTSSFAPLRRYLLNQVGRAWNEVFSEICRKTSSQSRSANEAREAFEGMVEQNVTLIDGVPHNERGYKINDSNWSPVWVHPQTGILMRSPRQPKRISTRKTTFEQIAIDAFTKLVKINDLWFVVSFEPLPEQLSEIPERDIVLNVVASTGYLGYRGVGGSFKREWGSNIYAVSKRQANKRELKKYVASAA